MQNTAQADVIPKKPENCSPDPGKPVFDLTIENRDAAPGCSSETQKQQDVPEQSGYQYGSSTAYPGTPGAMGGNEPVGGGDCSGQAGKTVTEAECGCQNQPGSGQGQPFPGPQTMPQGQPFPGYGPQMMPQGQPFPGPQGMPQGQPFPGPQGMPHGQPFPGPQGMPQGQPFPGPQGMPHGQPFPGSGHQSDGAPLQGFGPMPGYAPHASGHGAYGGPGQYKHDAHQYGQLMGLVNDIANGNADASRVMNYLSGLDAQFWKGALMGAALTFLFTNNKAKSTISGVFSSVTGAFDKEKTEETSE